VGRDRFSISRFFKDEAGAGAIEYGLLACIVALVVVFAAAKGVSPKLLVNIARALS
jgi:Flp pilus assembly pilin Flp